MQSIDLTPTWEGILPALLAIIEGSKHTAARNSAMAELRRMAQLADKYVAEHSGEQ
jgi:hypothetical protein